MNSKRYSIPTLTILHNKKILTCDETFCGTNISNHVDNSH